ncbi:hypothetical protein FZEAL_929 [Fusarium zealandicum]|uniref:Heterokaryon incompatibility domain-containing protein n=1 Tax=Fusarium zealandicum TaxID=1053134 RepID=A0A8H4UTS8_9HYPO|nr:hypothetical protein FZEAL_929 [Fusarium zealandicum]
MEKDTEDSKSTAPRPQNPLLCQKCQAWDSIESYKDWWHYDSDDFIILGDLLNNTLCMICIAATWAVRARLEQIGTSPASRVWVRNDGPFFLDEDTGDLERSALHRIDSSNPEESIVRLLLALEVRIDPENATVPTKEEIERSRFNMTPQFCLRYSIGKSTSHLASVDPWEVRYFDFSVLKQWIQGCSKLHGVECQKSTQTDANSAVDDMPRGFRVINLQTMNVVQPSSTVKYVALSYMWPPEKDSERVQLEKKNHKAMEQPGGLSNMALPPVIIDAILLCQKLGETYLWIDRFCIIQDDSRSKHDQIRKMDTIYRSATFTIIAALNEKEAPGLPGFTGRPRVSSIYKPGRKLDVELRGVKLEGLTMADSSLWNTRGWTFQERVLSNRRIYITEHQVLYECSLGYATEEFTWYPLHQNAFLSLSAPEEKGSEEEFKQLPGFSRWPKYGRLINFHITNSTSILDYLDWVKDYTSRQLSFGSDILNAFSGIEGSLEEVLGTWFVFGLPVRYLIQALMWNTSDPVELRRTVPPIPSWSWASATNRSNYDWLATWRTDPLRVVSLVYFHYQDPDKGLRRLYVQEWWVEREVPLEDFRYETGVPPIVEMSKKYLPGEARNSQTWRECPHNPWQTLAYPVPHPDACRVASSLPGSLVFNTTVANLRLRRHSPEFHKRTQGGTTDDMEILDCNGEPVGIIKCTSSYWSTTQASESQEQDIIVICGALAGWYTRKWWATVPFHDFDQWRLHVMLVARDEATPFVARRLGVGYIRAHLWKHCAPRWETVVLC